MPRKRPAIETKSGGERGITRVAADFLTSCAAQAGGLTVGQRALISRMALDLLSEAEQDLRRKRLEKS
jgi:hypothetical protein